MGIFGVPEVLDLQGVPGVPQSQANPSVFRVSGGGGSSGVLGVTKVLSVPGVLENLGEAGSGDTGYQGEVQLLKDPQSSYKVKKKGPFCGRK